MKKRKILVTGLCLSRNRGGAAMALSFAALIQQFLDLEFIFAVDPNYMVLEEKMARHYHLSVVGSDTLLTWFTNHPVVAPLLPMISKRQRRMGPEERREHQKHWHHIHNAYQDVIQQVSAVINLNGIAFVGDGTRSWLAAVSELTCSTYARKHAKPFYRFIQSYGPFSDWRVKGLAQMEFKGLPCIMARGQTAAAYCREIAGSTPVAAFPDVAVILPCADSHWLHSYLEHRGLVKGQYIVLSPSAVIARMPSKDRSAIGDQHVVMYAEIAKHFLAKGIQVLFVPHATFPDPDQCDRMVSIRCMKLLKNIFSNTTSFCSVVEEELDCRELKSLISGAQMAIVSRYHALVAALSTGVPAIAVGWNDKYRDIMAYYQCEKFVADARSENTSVMIASVIELSNQWSEKQKHTLKQRQPEIEAKVLLGGKICADWIKHVL